MTSETKTETATERRDLISPAIEDGRMSEKRHAQSKHVGQQDLRITVLPHDVPTLFSLPAELQKLIYEFAVTDEDSISIYMIKADNEDEDEITCRVLLTVIGEHVRKPAILGVCRSLRNLVTPIFFACNTFTINNFGLPILQMYDSLRYMWDERVKYRRTVQYRYFIQAMVIGENVLEFNIIVKLLECGRLAMSRTSLGYDYLLGAPEKDLCNCELHDIADSHGFSYKDNRRLFEMLGRCIEAYPSRRQDCDGVMILLQWSEPCTRCGRSDLLETEVTV